MEQYLTAFEAYLLTQKRVSRNTLESYMNDISQFYKFLIGKKLKIETVEHRDISLFFTYLRKNRRISAKSLSRKISSLKVFYRYLNERFNVPDNTDKLIFPKLEKNLPNFLTTDEVNQLLDTASLNKTMYGLRNNALINLLYVTGIRISEAVNLLISNIKFEENLVLVYGKGQKERLIPVSGQFIEFLKEFIKNYHTKICGNSQSDYLFPIKHGGKIKAMTRQSGWLILKKLVTESGLKKNVTPHTMRHSLATHLLENGANLRSLQVWLGHENLSTVEIYTHINTKHILNIYDKKHPRS